MFNGQRTEVIFKPLTLNAVKLLPAWLMFNAVKFRKAVNG